jgi:predicted GTPase
MHRWRFIILAALIVSPAVFLMGVGSYFLWERGWGTWAWMPMTASLALAYFLGWRWQRGQQLLSVDFSVPLRWTDRDRHAWKLVEARAAAVATLDAEKLGTLTFYVDTAKELALELARFYHPKAKDPLGSLTVVEILAVVELATRDLAEMVDQYLPAGNLLTVDHWLAAKKAAHWYQSANQAYWAISAVFSPINTALRYLASEIGLGTPLQKLQANLILWFYTAYVHRLGTYLIDVNSGRLRIGAERYRKLLAQQAAMSPAADAAQADAADTDAAEAVAQVTVTLLGQVKSGKSSLINALLGEERAHTDVLPATDAVTRYELKHEGIATRLVLLDTAGYGNEGPAEDQLRATEDAARRSDVLLLVLHARNPARQPDRALLQALERWFAARPDLKVPPVLGVLTHIDLLSPALEWVPPYNWQQPQKPKERQIEQAVSAVREHLGKHLVGVVAVCTAAGKEYGVSDGLLPALAELLDEARAVALLRCLRAEADTGKVRKVFEQLLSASKAGAKVLWGVVGK